MATDKLPGARMDGLYDLDIGELPPECDAAHDKPKTVRVVCPVCEGETTAENRCGECEDEGYINATLIPLASGPVVVDGDNWEEALEVYTGGRSRSDLSNEDMNGCGRYFGDEEADGVFADIEANLIKALTALFPAGIVVAEAVGRLNLLPGDEPIAVLMPVESSTVAGTAPVIEEGQKIAVLEEQP